MYTFLVVYTRRQEVNVDGHEGDQALDFFHCKGMFWPSPAVAVIPG